MNGNRPLALALFFALLPAGLAVQIRPVSAKETACYAFLQNGDIWVYYNGQAHALTKKGIYKDFVVNANGTRLALLIPAKNNPSSAHILIIETGNRVSTIEVAITTSVVSTCGTLASIENTVALERRVAITKDLLNGRNFSASDFADFRCSADGRVVVGYKNLQDRQLTVRGHPEKTTKLDYVPNLFDVSANGQFAGFYTSYIGQSPQLCSWEIGETAKCVADQNVFDRVSVSDSGDIIFATNSGESCLFKDGEHYSPKPKPGYDTDDECPDVAHWHPGMTEPEILTSLARHPQWLTDAAASRLANWQTLQF